MCQEQGSLTHAAWKTIANLASGAKILKLLKWKTSLLTQPRSTEAPPWITNTNLNEKHHQIWCEHQASKSIFLMQQSPKFPLAHLSWCELQSLFHNPLFDYFLLLVLAYFLWALKHRPFHYTAWLNVKIIKISWKYHIHVYIYII